MKFTYKGTECEVRMGVAPYGISFKAIVHRREVGLHFSSAQAAKASCKRFIDQIISNAAKESGK